MKVSYLVASVAVLLVLAGAVLVSVRLSGVRAPAAVVAPTPQLSVPSASEAPVASPAPDSSPTVSTPEVSIPNQAGPSATSQPVPATTTTRPRPPSAPHHGHDWDEWDHDDDHLSPAERQARDRARREAADAVCDHLGIPRWRCESNVQGH